MTDRDEQQKMLSLAAELGAKRALARVGLHDADAARDMTELRAVLEAWRGVKRGAALAVGKVLTTLLLGAILGALGLRHLTGGE